jgi:hypothetical protein
MCRKEVGSLSYDFGDRRRAELEVGFILWETVVNFSGSLGVAKLPSLPTLFLISFTISNFYKSHAFHHKTKISSQL